jgi:hypothetical protein
MRKLCEKLFPIFNANRRTAIVDVQAIEIPMIFETKSDRTPLAAVFHAVFKKISKNRLEPGHIGTDWDGPGRNSPKPVIDNYLPLFDFTGHLIENRIYNVLAKVNLFPRADNGAIDGMSIFKALLGDGNKIFNPGHQI